MAMQVPDKIQPICDELEAFYLKRTRNPALTEEIVEFAASTCWCRWATKDVLSLKRLLFTVARNYLLNLSKKQKGFSCTVNFELIPERVASRLQEETVLRLYRDYSQLPTQWQQLLDLIYYQNITKKKAAQLMGVSLATVKRWHTSALQALRVALPAQPD
jgi:RNA polymerase sigma factor (sigma-70 family)